MEIRSFDDIEEASVETALLLEQTISEQLSHMDSIVLGVPGGRSVGQVFALCAQKPLPWDRIRIFFVDERLVPLEDERSNYQVLHRNLLRPLEKNGLTRMPLVHPFDYENGGNAGEKYYDELRGHGGTFDVILLGSGEDGHVAGLFPGHHSIKEEKKGFTVYHDSPKPPPSRMSATKRLFMETNTAIVLFFGEAKRKAYESFLRSDVREVDCPAKIVQNIDKAYAITAFK